MLPTSMRPSHTVMVAGASLRPSHTVMVGPFGAGVS